MTTRLFSLLFASMLLAAAPGRAGDGLRVHEDSLANGLKILVLEKHDLPVASFQVWYRVGSRFERPGITGISHLLEHLMFKATDKVGSEEFSRVIQGRGGHANAFTSEDYTAYYENIAAEYLGTAMELEAARMTGLRFDSLEFATERDVVTEERRLSENSPMRSLMEKLDSIVFAVHGYGRPILGTMADLRSLDMDRVRRYYRAFYAPNNACAVIVGDVTPATATAMVKHCFGAIPRGSEAPPQPDAVEPPQQAERRIALVRESRTPMAALAFHTTRIGDPDSYALEVLASILFDGESSRLHQELVYKRQLAQWVRGYNASRADPTLFMITAAAQIGHSPRDLEQAVIAELEKVKQEGVTARELAKAKNQGEAGWVLAQEHGYGLGYQIGAAATQADWRLVNRYLPGIRAVSGEDIVRVAKKYFTPENRSVATLTPAEKK